jgi:Thoeris protein ThsB, TIR-like domain
MARRVFFSFHYKPDCWRAAKVRNMGAIEGNVSVSDNDWEAVKKGGNKAIKAWIDGQLHGRSCTVVLVGERTAGRKWIKYEIEESWNAGKGVVGIYVHNLEDSDGNQSQKGRNPFDDFTIGEKKLSSVVKLYDPPYKTSSYVYNHINENIAEWVEKAIQIRNSY